MAPLVSTMFTISEPRIDQWKDPVSRNPDDSDDDNTILLITAIFAVLCSLLGMISNLLTLLALPASSKAKSTATIFVLNLAAAEFLFSSIALPITAAQYIYHYKNDEELLTDDQCVIFTTIRYTITQAELQSVLAIALIRAIAVGMPKLYIFINRRCIIRTYVAFIWIYSVTIRIPTALGELVQNKFGSYGFNNQTLECDVSTNAETTRNVFLVIDVILPIVAIASCYSFTYFKVRQNSNQMRASLCHSTGSQFYKQRPLYVQLFRRDRRVARTVFIVFLIMIICSVPVGVTHKGSFAEDNRKLFHILHILYWFQFSINPVVYAIMNQNYRVAFHDFLNIKKSNNLPTKINSWNLPTSPSLLIRDSTYIWKTIPSKIINIPHHKYPKKYIEI